MALIQSLSALGASFGTIFSGPLCNFGVLKCLIGSNFFFILGSLLCCFFVQDIRVFSIGVFIFGLAGGANCVFGPKFIMETAPAEVSGSAGALTNITIALGLSISFIIGAAWSPKELND